MPHRKRPRYAAAPRRRAIRRLVAHRNDAEREACYAAGTEAGAISEEVALCSRLAALHIRIVGRARRAIGSRDLDLHTPGQHQIGHEHGQDMLDAVRHGADERDVAVKLEELVVIEGLHMHAHRRNSISPVSGFMDCTMASDSR